MFKIVIFASDEVTFLSRKTELKNLSVLPDSIIWCNSRLTCRGSFINAHLNTWLLFLDHDCHIDQVALEKVKTLILNTSLIGDYVFSGLYRNPENSSYFQQAHNFIANTWLLQSYSAVEYNKLMLGGVFLIHSTQPIEIKDDVLFWGAEDKVLSYALNKQKFRMTLVDNLEICHKTSSSVRHFIVRAFLHGRNEIKHLDIKKNKINYLFWIRKIGFVNLYLSPLILLHFCIQRVALLFQKARHSNRP